MYFGLFTLVSKDTQWSGARQEEVQRWGALLTFCVSLCVCDYEKEKERNRDTVVNRRQEKLQSVRSPMYPEAIILVCFTFG